MNQPLLLCLCFVLFAIAVSELWQAATEVNRQEPPGPPVEAGPPRPERAGVLADSQGLEKERGRRGSIDEE